MQVCRAHLGEAQSKTTQHNAEIKVLSQPSQNITTAHCQSNISYINIIKHFVTTTTAFILNIIVAHLVTTKAHF